MVRVFKNLRDRLVEDGYIKRGIAPSYYPEGLLYNVPDEKFTNGFQDCFVNTINWIQSDADESNLICANEQYYLLWDKSDMSWPRAHCEAFLEAAIKLCNEW